MSRQVVAHYGSSWARHYNETVARVQQVLGTDAETFVYTGSGHCGLDTVCNSLLDPGSEVLVLDNGHFGRRLATIAGAHGLVVHTASAPWGRPFPPERAAAALAEHPGAQAVLVVQTETSAGIRNDIEAIAEVVRLQDRLLVVDAVASAGVSPLSVDTWGIDVLVTASQKGLGAPPGLVVVTVGQRAWALMDRRQHEPRGWYTNLLVWRQFARDRRDFQPYFITMAVNNLTALHESLEEVLEEGLDRRIRRHQRVSRRLRQGLAAAGLEPVAPTDEGAAEALTAVRVPDGASALAWRDRLEDDHGIVVSTGLGPPRDQILRVGHMGPLADERVIDRVLAALHVVAGERAS